MNPTVLVRWRRIALSTLGTLIIGMLASCGAGTPTAAPTPPPTTVRVQLSWIHSIEWAGLYVAEEKGYYAEQRLATKLLPGGSDAQGNYIDPIGVVVAGNADFGVINGSALLQARENAVPVVAVAAIYQRHPLTFTSLAAKGIIRPQDLIGKKVLISSSSRPLFNAMLTSQGIDPAQFGSEERTDVTSAPLTTGQADVIDGWVINEVVALKQQGQAVNLILPSDYGVEEYPNIIFTTEKMIVEQPAVVEQFLHATLRGIDGVIADPNRGAMLAVQYDPTRNLATETEGIQQSLPLLNPPGSRPGMMNAETWTITERIFREQGILKKPVDSTSAFTLTFLDKIYGK